MLPQARAILLLLLVAVLAWRIAADSVLAALW
jgi:hypothetical protein